MKNYSFMQTIARANRVFPEKTNGLIVDDIGVFRNLAAGPAEPHKGTTGAASTAS